MKVILGFEVDSLLALGNWTFYCEPLSLTALWSVCCLKSTRRLVPGTLSVFWAAWFNSGYSSCGSFRRLLFSFTHSFNVPLNPVVTVRCLSCPRSIGELDCSGRCGRCSHLEIWTFLALLFSGSVVRSLRLRSTGKWEISSRCSPSKSGHYFIVPLVSGSHLLGVSVT